MPRECLHESELFRFINNETPAVRSWLVNYLNKKGIPVTIEFPDEYTVAYFLEHQLNRHGFNYERKKALARDMANAWRGYRHRKNKNVVSLTVRLDKSVFTKLSEMSKGFTQAEIITRLVEGNYQTFLAMKHEQEQKKAEAKEIDKKRKELNQLKKMISKPMAESSLINKQVRVANDLKDIISMLDDITADLTNKET